MNFKYTSLIIINNIFKIINGCCIYLFSIFIALPLIMASAIFLLALESSLAKV